MKNINLVGMSKETGRTLLYWSNRYYYLDPPYKKANAHRAYITIENPPRFINFKNWDELEAHCCVSLVKQSCAFLGNLMHTQAIKKGCFDADQLIQALEADHPNQNDRKLARALLICGLNSPKDIIEVTAIRDYAHITRILDNIYPAILSQLGRGDCEKSLLIDRDISFFISTQQSNCQGIARNAYNQIKKQIYLINRLSNTSSHKSWENRSALSTKKYIRGGIR